MWLILIWTAAAVLAVVLYVRQAFSHFRRKGVKHDPIIPPFGNMAKILLKQQHLADQIKSTYVNNPEERFVGRYQFTKPIILVRDVELIKKIAIKDFEHFTDHSIFIDPDQNPLIGRIVLLLKGQEWKDMRSTLSPAFTSSKMKHMVPFMVAVGDQTIVNLKQKIKESGTDYIDVDVKDLTTRFANDVIASCAFGLKVDSQADANNEFYNNSRNVSGDGQFITRVIFIITSTFPWITRTLKIKAFDTNERDRFFRDLVLQTMQSRDKQTTIRPDMIHLLNEAKKGKLSYDEKSNDTGPGFATVEESSVGKKQHDRSWSDDHLVAQAVMFLIAGFETVSTAMSFLLHELAINPDVQDRLVKEIREMDAKVGGKFDYTGIQNMKYMDMVVSELLRFWPPIINLDRVCVKDYNLGRPNDKATEDYIIRKGEALHTATRAIHRDPKYFENPDKFDPERFSDENKHKINPFAYSPFGLGPRNCIGSRFALCEVKIMAYMLLLHIEVVPGPKTQIPGELDPTTFNIRLKGGHWLRFKTRK